MAPVAKELAQRWLARQQLKEANRRAGGQQPEWPMQIGTLLRLAAWCALGIVVFATLSPVGLRPDSGLPAEIERFAAFLGMGLLFGLAYRKRPFTSAILVLSSALGLELLQLLAPSRHGMLPDAGMKLAGAAIGLAFAWAAGALIKWLRGR